jgi:hypothetical protein
MGERAGEAIGRQALDEDASIVLLVNAGIEENEDAAVFQ